MVVPSAGSVVLLPFPFSNLAEAKLRPALVLACAERQDWALCQVTSRPYGDSRAISLSEREFSEGSLRIESFVRPGKLFTANEELLISKVGQVKREYLLTVIEAVVQILRSGLS